MKLKILILTILYGLLIIPIFHIMHLLGPYLGPSFKVLPIFIIMLYAITPLYFIDKIKKSKN